MLCPGCGGVLDSSLQLKSVHKEAYDCALCSQRLRADARRDGRGRLHREPAGAAGSRRTIRTRCRCGNTSGRFSGAPASTCRRTGLEQILEEITIDSIELGPGEKGADLGAAAARVRHRVRAGDACRAFHRRQGRADQGAADAVADLQQGASRRRSPPRCGRARCGSRSRTRATCARCRRCGSPAHTLHDLLGKRRPFLTAKRLLTNQTFRDIYRTDTLDVDQGLKITSLTFLFTDLKGSTELYERVGDIVAYDLVREHFRVLNEIVASEARRGGQDHRRRGDGDVPVARPRARRGAAHARVGARA